METFIQKKKGNYIEIDKSWNKNCTKLVGVINDADNIHTNIMMQPDFLL